MYLVAFVRVLWTLSAASLAFASVGLDKACCARTTINKKGQMSPNTSLFCARTDVLMRLIDFQLHLQAIALQTPNYLKGYIGHQEWRVVKIGNTPEKIY